MELEVLNMDLTVCMLSSADRIDLSKDLFFIGKTDREISLVCKAEDVPEHVLEREDGWRGFRIRGVLDFSLIGILARISSLLAESGISIFALSTYQTDYILVREGDFERALALLSGHGYKILRRT